MKQKPRWTLEMLIAALAVLCALLTLALLVQRPAGWPALAVLVVLWGIGICVFRYQLRRWTAKWVAGGSFENSRTQYSLESLSQPAALLSGETVLWYNSRFRTAGRRGPACRQSTEAAARPGHRTGAHPGGAAAQSGRWCVECAQQYRAGRQREHDAACVQ